MTDAELVRAVAKRVMGWEGCAPFGSRGMIITRRLANALQRAANTWEPLADWNDCWMVAEKAGLWDLAYHEKHGWLAICGSSHKTNPDPRRAILLAALASVDANPGPAPGER